MQAAQALSNVAPIGGTALFDAVLVAIRGAAARGTNPARNLQGGDRAVSPMVRNTQASRLISISSSTRHVAAAFSCTPSCSLRTMRQTAGRLGK